jgi:hypothetical protein
LGYDRAILRRRLVVLGIVAILVAWVACSHQRGSQGSGPGAGEPPHVSYARELWPHWRDADHDCQNTRNEVLIAESLVPVTFADPRHCKVARGRWRCPYTGRVFTDPHELDIDHLVPLAQAHASGGDRWTRRRREAYANDLRDPDHLVAVSRGANRAKGAQAPDTWLPAERASWCWYAAAWKHVKTRWALVMREPERKAVEQLLVRCAP